MRNLYIKQKVLSLNEKFTVKDQKGDDVYYVEGSFMKIPKTFRIMDKDRNEAALITKKVFSLLPKFFVEADGHEVLMIKKEFTFFKSRYTIDAEGIEVVGNWWDMTFEVYKDRQEIARVSKQWFSWGDSYQVEILDESMEKIVVALVIAIDCVKADDNSSSSVMAID